MGIVASFLFRRIERNSSKISFPFSHYLYFVDEFIHWAKNLWLSPKTTTLTIDCFSRGLLREALGQLAGLRRRKKALEMLGAAIQKGLDYKDAQQQQQDKVGGTYVDVKEEEQQPAISQKRKSDDEPGDGSAAEADTDGSIHPPPAKKVKT
jgi:hypothetical protein